MGDLLFVAVNVARFLGVDPETALRRSNRKFERRFRYVESKIKSQGRELKDASLAEMDALWEEAKKLELDAAPENLAMRTARAANYVVMPASNSASQPRVARGYPAALGLLLSIDAQEPPLPDSQSA